MKGFLRVCIQCMSHRADGFIIRKRKHALRAALVLPMRPCAIDGMLHDRELVGVVANIVYKPRQQDRV